MNKSQNSFNINKEIPEQIKTNLTRKTINNENSQNLD